MVERYECTTGGHNKFWEVEVKENILIVRFGRIGSNGRKSENKFGTEKEALAARDKLAKEKLGKGYRKTDATENPRKGKIIYKAWIEPMSAFNEGFLLAELFTYWLRKKLTPKQVSENLGYLVDPPDDLDDDLEYPQNPLGGDADEICRELLKRAVSRVAKEFDYGAAISKALDKCYTDDPDTDSFRIMLEDTPYTDILYKKAFREGAESFVLHDEGGAGCSIVAVSGLVTDEDLDNYEGGDEEDA